MDYEFPRGDTYMFPDSFRFTDSNGEVLILKPTDKIYMTVRKTPNDKTKIFQKTLGNGITVDSEGYYSVLIDANDTYKLPYGTYGFDISIKTNDGIVSTPVIGSITLTEEYTFKEDEV